MRGGDDGDSQMGRVDGEKLLDRSRANLIRVAGPGCSLIWSSLDLCAAPGLIDDREESEATRTTAVRNTEESGARCDGLRTKKQSRRQHRGRARCATTSRNMQSA